MARSQARRTANKKTSAKNSQSGRPILMLCIGVVIGLLIPKGIELVEPQTTTDIANETNVAPCLLYTSDAAEE